MAHRVPNTDLMDAIWPEDIKKRRNYVLFLWIVFVWFWLVMGTLSVTNSIFALLPGAWCLVSVSPICPYLPKTVGPPINF